MSETLTSFTRGPGAQEKFYKRQTVYASNYLLFHHVIHNNLTLVGTNYLTKYISNHNINVCFWDLKCLMHNLFIQDTAVLDIP